jgi:hypothetical protein
MKPFQLLLATFSTGFADFIIFKKLIEKGLGGKGVLQVVVRGGTFFTFKGFQQIHLLGGKDFFLQLQFSFHLDAQPLALQLPDILND